MLPFMAVCHAESDNFMELPGDVNNDGIVNVMDAELLSYHLLGINNEAFNDINADLNHNQMVDIMDLVDLIMLILGIDRSKFIDQILAENEKITVTETPCHSDDIISSDDTAAASESVASTDTVSELTSDTPEPELPEAEIKADAVFNLINEIRTSNGLNPFEKMEVLDSAAMTRAAEISQIFSHKRPDGSSCFSILDEYDMFYMAAGENIAYGSSTAEGVVEQWMNSAGHRDNIMNPNYSILGVGYYKTDETNYCWTQLFIAL